MVSKRRPIGLFAFGLVGLLVGGWVAFVGPAWADLRYRAAVTDFMQAKRQLEDLATAEWQDRVLGVSASKADAVEAAAQHIDACEQVSGLGAALHKRTEQLEDAGNQLATVDKRDLARQLATAATEYADAYQASLEDFCDKALDAVVAQMSPKRTTEVNAIRQVAASILRTEKRRADEPAARIQTTWPKLDAVLFRR